MFSVPKDWPNAQYSQCVITKRHQWHVQIVGQGPDVLLIHGTGGSTHSWVPLVQFAKNSARFIMVDLPGHGLSQCPAMGQSTISAITQGLVQVLDQLGIYPESVMGHSAGAVIAVELAQILKIRQTVLLNAAFAEFPSFLSPLFHGMARTMVMAPFVTRGLAQMGKNPDRIKRILQQTGSNIPNEQMHHYQRLFRSDAHIRGTLQLMADWDIAPFLQLLPTYDVEMHFITGANDKTVDPAVSRHWSTKVPNGHLTPFERFGHLILEEAAADIWAATIGKA